MEKKYLTLINKNTMDILKFFPGAIQIMVDTVGEWKIKDLHYLFVNNASDILFGEHFDGPIVFQTAATENSLQAQLSLVKNEVENGTLGFIGPFSHTYTRHDQVTIHIANYILYLGKVDEMPTFFIFFQDRSAEEVIRRIKISDYTRNNEPMDDLTNREQSVAKLILKKLNTKQIAHELGVSERTIENHRANIRRKMNLTNRPLSINKYLSSLRNT